MRQAIAKHTVIGLLLAAPLGAEPAFAEPRSENRLEPALAERRSENRFMYFTQCAAASDICAWKRIPGAGPIVRAPRRAPRPRSPGSSN